MDEKMKELIEESLSLELNVAELYLIFHDKFKEDKDFWWQLALEEKNHASILAGGLQALESNKEFPTELIAGKLEDIRRTNGFIKGLIKDYKDNPPSRETAFIEAIELEESAGELHFQMAMEKGKAEGLLKIFQDLNNDDKDHAERLYDYVRQKGIEI